DTPPRRDSEDLPSYRSPLPGDDDEDADVGDLDGAARAHAGHAARAGALRRGRVMGTIDPGLALDLLYPSLAPKEAASDAELLTSAMRKMEDSVETKRAFFAREAEKLVAMARGLATVFEAGGRLLTMGNGGSSCDAAHVAVEFNHPITVGRKPLASVHLGGDLAMISAVGNDVGFDQIFARQVISHGRAGDALMGFSTSGNSKNLLAAFEQAKRMGLRTYGFAGGDGGHMAESAAVDLCLVVPTPSVHRVQESHLLAYHALWDLVHTILPTGAQAPEVVR
ncbi:MAG: SIS domain-containing protein, partial [Myxococcota bacterium]